MGLFDNLLNGGQLTRIENKIDLLSASVQALAQSQRKQNMATQAELDALAAAVAQNTDVEASAAQALNQLVANVATLTQQLADAVANGDSAAVQAATAQLQANNTALQAAIPALSAAIANTAAPSA